MATNTFVELDLSEACNIADLTGICFDLETAKEFALKLQSMIGADPPDYSLVDALSTAILVRYSRAFVSGVRRPLCEEALQTLTEDQRAKHKDLRALRDKHIAHSVNCFEESIPVARYWIERVQFEGITAISCSHDRVIGLSNDDIETVVELTRILLDFVKQRIKAEEARLLSIVRAMPLADVLSVKMRAINPGKGLVDKKRKR